MIVGDVSGAWDEQQARQDPPVEDKDESSDFVSFPDDRSSVHDEDHRSAFPEPHIVRLWGICAQEVGPCGIACLIHMLNSIQRTKSPANCSPQR